MRIDAHVHVFSPTIAADREAYLQRDLTFRSLYANPESPMSTAEAVIEAMDRSGIDRAVLVNIGWTTQELCEETNAYALEAARAHPDRLTAFCVVNPLAGEEAVKEIDRCAAGGAKGVGELHPDTQGFDLGDAAVMSPVMEAARRHGMPVLTHASEPVGHGYAGKGQVTPGVLYRFITSFPDSTIVCAHWGGGLPFYALMPEVRKALENVWFDSATSPFLYEPAIFEKVVGLIGAEKVLFATDFPLIKPERLLKQVERADLSDEARDRILGGNAARLLGLS